MLFAGRGAFLLLSMPVTSCVVTGTALRDAIRSLLAIKKTHFPSSSPLCRQGIKPIRPADGLFCSGIVAAALWTNNARGTKGSTGYAGSIHHDATREVGDAPALKTKKTPIVGVFLFDDPRGQYLRGHGRTGNVMDRRSSPPSAPLARPAQSADGARRTRTWIQRSRSSAARSSSPVVISRQTSPGSSSSRPRTPASSISVKRRPSGLRRRP